MGFFPEWTQLGAKWFLEIVNGLEAVGGSLKWIFPDFTNFDFLKTA
jgi:hypothetical protein